MWTDEKIQEEVSTVASRGYVRQLTAEALMSRMRDEVQAKIDEITAERDQLRDGLAMLHKTYIILGDVRREDVETLTDKNNKLRHDLIFALNTIDPYINQLPGHDADKLIALIANHLQ
jgi:hypothetical protein